MAVSATSRLAMRGDGAAGNAGLFDPSTPGAGTDYSLQAAPQVSFTDLATGATATSVTSAAFPLSALHVGNYIRIPTGVAGWTAGNYRIVSVAGVVATLDTAPAAINTTGGQGKLGGAVGSWAEAATILNTVATTAGLTVNVFSVGGEIALSAAVTITGGGAQATPLRILGHGAAIGDIASPASTLKPLTRVASGYNPGLGTFVLTLPAGTILTNLRFSSFLGTYNENHAMILVNAPVWYGVEILGGFRCQHSGGVFTSCFFGCRVYNAGSTSVLAYNGCRFNTSCTLGDLGCYHFSGCLFDGANIQANNVTTGSFGVTFDCCVVIGSSNPSILTNKIVVARDTVFFASPGSTALSSPQTQLERCFLWGGGAGVIGGGSSSGLTTLSGDPFVNRATGDFRLNRTAGAGLTILDATGTYIPGVTNTALWGNGRAGTPVGITSADIAAIRADLERVGSPVQTAATQATNAAGYSSDAYGLVETWSADGVPLPLDYPAAWPQPATSATFELHLAGATSSGGCGCRSASPCGCSRGSEATLYQGDTRDRVFFLLDAGKSVVALPAGIHIEIWDDDVKLADATVTVTDPARWSGVMSIGSGAWADLPPRNYWLRVLDGDDVVQTVQALTVLSAGAAR